MTSIKFEDYLSEQERKDIVADVFRQQCEETVKKDYERIISNSAYAIVKKLVDEQMGGKMEEFIKAKTIDVIEKLGSFTVFNAPTWYDKVPSAGYKMLQEAVIESKPLLKDKIKSLIDSLDEDRLKEAVMEQAQELLDLKLFGAKNGK
jgi:hypothetical protein